jgi:uncharacterized protein YkwD
VQVEAAVQRTGRRTAILVVLALAIATLSLFAPAPAGASPGADRSDFVAALNRSRAELRNAAPLRPAADLDAVAERHAAAMAARGSIFHNPELGRQVERWESVGENVGVGPDVATLHQAFLDSPAHRTNLLDDRYLEVGIGIVERGGHLWVVEVFRRELPAGAVVTSDPVPAPVVPDAAALAATASARSVELAPAAVAPAPREAAAPQAARTRTSDRSDGPSVLPLAWAVLTVGVLLAAVSGHDRPGPRLRRPMTA